MYVHHYSLIQKADLPPYTAVCATTDYRSSLAHPIPSSISESAVGYASGSVIETSPVPVLLRSHSDTIQIPPNPLIYFLALDVPSN